MEDLDGGLDREGRGVDDEFVEEVDGVRLCGRLLVDEELLPVR